MRVNVQIFDFSFQFIYLIQIFFLLDTLGSLKIDAATYHERTFLGVILQFRKSITEHRSYTLASEEMIGEMTGKNIKKTVVDILSRFSLSLKEVITVTSDNGSNMVKSMRVMNYEARKAMKGKLLVPSQLPIEYVKGPSPM